MASTTTGTAAPRARSASAAASPSSRRGGRTPAAIVRRSAIVAATSSTAASNAGASTLRVARERALEPAEGDAERDEALLRAVVQVALEPAALLVARLGDPRARGLDLGELEPQLHAQPPQLDGDGRGVEHAAQQVGAAGQRRVVQEHADLAADRADRGPRARHRGAPPRDGRAGRRRRSVSGSRKKTSAPGSSSATASTAPTSSGSARPARTSSRKACTSATPS